MAEIPEIPDELVKTRSKMFIGFLDDEERIINYKEEIKKMLRLKQFRLIINLDDIRSYNRQFCDG